VPGTGPSGSAKGGDGDDVWLDLVARFNEPLVGDETPPWPDREDLAGAVHATPATPPAVPEALPQEPPTNPGGIPGLSALSGMLDDRSMPGPGLDSVGPRSADLGNASLESAGLDSAALDNAAPDSAAPDDTRPGGAGRHGSGVDDTMHGQPWSGQPKGRHARDWPAAGDPAGDHYVPPVPPPLPKLSSATKIAWLALFGGPLYLLVSTATGTPISGLAAFLAVAAFVGGFVVIVLRMDNGRPPDSGSGDDGAVV
jgi:hypothetical protein